MLDPYNNYRRYMIWTFILIIFLLVYKVAVADEKSTGDKVGEVLDKIEKLENDKSVYYDKIVTLPKKK